MALGLLLVLFTVLAILAVFIQILLYKRGTASNNGIFIVNMVFVFIISYLVYTALPMNYTGLKMLAIAWSVMALIAVVLKVINNNFMMISKVLLTIAVVGSLIQLFA